MSNFIKQRQVFSSGFAKTNYIPQGPNGYVLSTNNAAPLGFEFVPNPNGDSGPIGPTGPTGVAGLYGDQGPKGPTGPVGIVGEVGSQGPTGSTGNVGVVGGTGNTGSIGSTGTTGNTGQVGTVGIVGPIGPIGPVGPVGLVGPAGVRGLPGTTGNTGQTGATGNQGIQGQRGPVGINGLPGAGGAQGPTGATGIAGLPGAVGATGATGNVGSVGNTGPTGATGAAGLRGPAGTNFPRPGITPFTNQSQRDAFSANAFVGQFAFTLDNNRLSFWSGINWVAYPRVPVQNEVFFFTNRGNVVTTTQHYTAGGQTILNPVEGGFTVLRVTVNPSNNFTGDNGGTFRYTAPAGTVLSMRTLICGCGGSRGPDFGFGSLGGNGGGGGVIEDFLNINGSVNYNWSLAGAIATTIQHNQGVLAVTNGGTGGFQNAFFQGGTGFNGGSGGGGAVLGVGFLQFFNGGFGIIGQGTNGGRGFQGGFGTIVRGFGGGAGGANDINNPSAGRFSDIIPPGFRYGAGGNDTTQDSVFGRGEGFFGTRQNGVIIVRFNSFR